MKTVGTALQAHLENETTTIAVLIKITRADGVVIGLCNHDADLTVDGITYQARGAFNGATLKNAALLKTNNFEIEGLLDSDAISEADLKAGLFDHARIDVFWCNWANVAQGVIQVRRGWIGEVSLIDGKYVAELRGLHDLLQRRVGDVYTAECRHVFCGAACSLAASSMTVAGSVTAITDRATFADSSRTESDGAFNYGLLTWTSGLNKGLSMEVKSWASTGTLFTLWLPMTYALSVGDAYSVVRGCDKKFATCRDTYANVANFGGFPHLPGLAKVLQYPDSE
jgi:uncharacterized phage protein (TIGR02218 family)